MTDQHRATPEQWAQQEMFSELNEIDSSCIMELLLRVQALEAAQQQPRIFTTDEVAPFVYCKEAPAVSSSDASSWKPEARAALLVVADWLRSELNSRNVADLLENEANR